MIKTAAIFPGQGSQIVGMCKDLYDQYPIAKSMIDQADSLLGFKLSSIFFDGPEESLKETQNTQPALFVHSMIVAEILKELGVTIHSAAGHSLGEFSALGFAGAFDFKTGVRLVHERGILMQEAAQKNPGAMAAIIGLETEILKDVCAQALSEGIVQPANFNSPGQIVISGSLEGVTKAMELAKMKGAKRALQLPVSGAFHSPLMETASESFKRIIDTIQFEDLKCPVYANVTAQANLSGNNIGDLLVRQLTHSVRWIEIIEQMIQDGVTQFIEMGPGKVLSGLVKRIHKEVTVQSVGTVDDIQSIQL